MFKKSCESTAEISTWYLCLFGRRYIFNVFRNENNKIKIKYIGWYRPNAKK